MSSQPLLAQAEQLFHHLFQQASLGVAVEDLEGKLLLANRALCSMLGYSESELVAMSCSQFANPEDSEDDLALFQQLRAGVRRFPDADRCVPIAEREVGPANAEQGALIARGGFRCDGSPSHQPP